MAAPVNTRRMDRFKPDSRSLITIAPSGSYTQVSATLLDLNKFGGLGLFVPARTAFDRMSVATLLDQWIMNRSSTQGDISMTIRFFHAIPRIEDGRKGIRVSAMLVQKDLRTESSKFLTSTRRRSKRVPKDRDPAKLVRSGLKIDTRVMNVGDDDGVGVLVDADALAKITWGELFQDGWEFAQDGFSLTCFVQRISLQDKLVIIGGAVPGVNKARQWAETAGKSAPAEKVASEADDASLMDLLDQVLSKKK